MAGWIGDGQQAGRPFSICRANARPGLWVQKAGNAGAERSSFTTDPGGADTNSSQIGYQPQSQLRQATNRQGSRDLERVSRPSRSPPLIGRSGRFNTRQRKRFVSGRKQHDRQGNRFHCCANPARCAVRHHWRSRPARHSAWSTVDAPKAASWQSSACCASAPCCGRWEGAATADDPGRIGAWSRSKANCSRPGSRWRA